MTYNVTFGDSIELNCTINYAPDLKDVTLLRSTIPHVAEDMGDTTVVPQLLVHIWQFKM